MTSFLPLWDVQTQYNAILEEKIQRFQGGRRIAASSSQSCSDGDSLLKTNGDPSLVNRTLEQGGRSSMDQILSSGGQTRIACPDRDPRHFSQREPERVMKADLLEDRSDFVISVFPLFDDFQHQVNFGGGISCERSLHLLPDRLFDSILGKENTLFKRVLSSGATFEKPGRWASVVLSETMWRYL